MKNKTLEELMILARDVVMTDAQRREQAASFAYGNLALTAEWRYKPESELVKLRALCMEMAGVPRPRFVRPEICGEQSHDNWEDEDDLPVTCSLPPHETGDHMGGTRCGTVTWPGEPDFVPCVVGDPSTRLVKAKY